MTQLIRRARGIALLMRVVLILCAVDSAVQAQDAASASVTVFSNVRIFDGKSDQLSPPSNVLVRGNRIEKISTDPIPVDRRADTTLIDGK
ncbi:MAG TPA: amidohydrolase family protein, partial [Verrucomicrobiae bacterium]